MAAGDFPSAAAQARAIADRLAHLRPALEVVGADVVAFVTDRFDTSTAPDGSGWRPLEEATLLSRASRRAGGRPGRARERRRAAIVNTGKPLVDTARLRNSITFRATDDTLYIGTNVVYAATHQLGRAAIPARPFLPFRRNGSAFDLEMRGPARALWARAEETLRRYVEEGR